MNKSNNKKQKPTSLRHFSWDNKLNTSNEEKLIKSTVLEWYDAKHREITKEEINLINNISITTCPFCFSNDIRKNGHTKRGIQRFSCKNCYRRFNTLTGTIFDSKKIPISEWIEYLLHLFEFHSIKTSAIDNRNSPTTGKYWLKKVFSVLENIQDEVILNGTIYIDEMFLPVNKSKEVIKNGKKLRGISKNKICVASAVNNEGKSIFITCSTSKLSELSCYNAYAKHIKEGSLIIHDGEKAHNYLTEKLKLKSKAYKSKEIKQLKDKDNPLFPINNLHSLAKRFFRSHGSYDRNDIQSWLNLFWFIVNEPENKYDKVLKFLQIALKKRKIIRYRDKYPDK